MPAGMPETSIVLPVGAVSRDEHNLASRLIPATNGNNLLFHRHDIRGKVLRITLLERQVWHRGVRQHQEGRDDFGCHAWLRRNRRERDDVALSCRRCANGVTSWHTTVPTASDRFPGHAPTSQYFRTAQLRTLNIMLQGASELSDFPR